MNQTCTEAQYIAKTLWRGLFEKFSSAFYIFSNDLNFWTEAYFDSKQNKIYLKNLHQKQIKSFLMLNFNLNYTFEIVLRQRQLSFLPYWLHQLYFLINQNNNNTDFTHKCFFFTIYFSSKITYFSFKLTTKNKKTLCSRQFNALNINKSQSKEMWSLSCITSMINIFLLLRCAKPKT